VPVLKADVACRRVGYLCAALADSATVVVERWKDFHGVMVVHVPPPPFEDPGTARELQDAAADGILSWNGQPFPIVVDRRGRRPAGFEVTWKPTLGSDHLGLTHTQWSRSGGLRVLSLELSTRTPSDPSRILDPSVVRLTAAHEMGHALGLPHSDQPRDVMYPNNTATALSARDYRTVEALYALENGTRIVR
jgi:predicted Zn-dependent protease